MNCVPFQVIGSVKLLRDEPEGLCVVEGSEGNNYHVSVQQPSCQCPDWRRNHLPCKHLLAVCKAHPSLSWDSIPGSYRDSVLFTLDLAHDIEDPPDDNPPDVPWTAGSPLTADSSCDDATKDTNTNTDYKDAANIMSRARDTLTRVHDMTYLRFNKEVAEEVATSLAAVEVILTTKCERSDDVPIIDPDLNVTTAANLPFYMVKSHETSTLHV